MKFLHANILFAFCLAWLCTGCAKSDDPAPACIAVEVVGPYDCPTGAYVLKLLAGAPATADASNGYLGQLREGYVVTQNLPEAYQHAGLRVNLALEVDDAPTQVCPAIHVIYPAVRVARLCSAK
ncbi:hypothetical protein ACXYMU_01320 [Pontibacter sp. CAU 1760]